MAKSDNDDKEGKDGEKSGKGGKLKLMIMVLPTVLLIAGGAFFFLHKSAPAGPVKEPPPVPGAVVKLDDVTINLAGGHFLKLGMALQPTASAGEEISGAHAEDLAISLYSGKTIDELSSKDGREKAKAMLIKEVSEAYEKKVYDIYFTEFVMQ